MKIKDMIKKVEAYNEVAEIIHGDKMAITFHEFTINERITDYKQFSKFIRKTYLNIIADAILDGEYEFDTDTAFTVTGPDGYIFNVTVSFDIYAA